MLIDESMRLFSGSAYPELAQEIAEELGLKLGNASIGRYNNGEIFVKIKESIHGADVFIIQPTSMPVNDNIIELLMLINAVKRASADRITAIIPYYGYSGQDCKTTLRSSIGARLMADLLYTSGVDRIITVDILHSQIQGFFNVPVHQIIGTPLIIDYFRKNFLNIKEFTIVASEYECIEKAELIASKLNIPLSIIELNLRRNIGIAEYNIIGELTDKVILIDSTFSTNIFGKVQRLKEAGADEVIVCCSHPVLSGYYLDRINESPINELIVLDTMKIPYSDSRNKIRVISITSVVADMIRRVHDELPKLKNDII